MKYQLIPDKHLTQKSDVWWTEHNVCLGHIYKVVKENPDKEEKTVIKKYGEVLEVHYNGIRWINYYDAYATVGNSHKSCGVFRTADKAFEAILAKHREIFERKQIAEMLEDTDEQ
jgi:hypothetical protein